MRTANKDWLAVSAAWNKLSTAFEEFDKAARTAACNNPDTNDNDGYDFSCLTYSLDKLIKEGRNGGPLLDVKGLMYMSQRRIDKAKKEVII